MFLLSQFNVLRYRDQSGDDQAMKIGFTGTRSGMTEEQIKVLIKVLLYAVEITEVHHGDCVGADAQFHDLIRKIDPGRLIKIVGHPASNFRHYQRANKECDELREAKPSLIRNHDIVDECDDLIAAPKGTTEILRSGTWSTIRYAGKQKKEIFIVEPSGNIKTINVNVLV